MSGPRTKYWTSTIIPHPGIALYDSSTEFTDDDNVLGNYIDFPAVWDADKMTYLIMGREYAPTTGTEHYQSFIIFKEVQRLAAVKKVLGGNYHCEPMAKGATPLDNVRYCSKGRAASGRDEPIEPQVVTFGFLPDFAPGKRNDIARVQEAVEAGASMEELVTGELGSTVARVMPYTRTLLAVAASKRARSALETQFDAAVLQPWQAELEAYISGPVDPRKIKWFRDLAGGKGKSWLASYFVFKYNAEIFTSAKVADIAHAYKLGKIVIFDLCRSEGSTDGINEIYKAIEYFKNGRIFSPKYDSVNKFFPVPHVIVFANFDPDTSRLSEDRWDIIHMD